MPHDAPCDGNSRSAILNLPNVLTSLRLVLAIVLFGFMACGWFWTGFWLFLIAAGTDWFDGYFARKYGQVTTLGRILDPFADKVIICGTFILLAAVPELTKMPWGLQAWMVVVIVGRELLVTALRSFIEERGGDFSARMSGKWKMLLQCVAAATCLFWLSYETAKQPAPEWCHWLLIVSVWSALVLTVYSGAVYIRAAVRRLG
jgi:CDP-diacylglycerol---glycerol-3-phosphate 3-phosphatidyltransferase